MRKQKERDFLESLSFSVTICCCYLQALGIFHGQRTTTKAYGCRNFQKMRKQKERDFLESLSFFHASEMGSVKIQQAP